MNKIAYLVALQQAPGIGSRRALNLLDYFGNVENIWSAKAEDIKQALQMPEVMRKKFAQYIKTVDVEKLYSKVLDSGCWVITMLEDDYPKFLKEIYDPPLVLYGKGCKAALGNQSVAVVGCRKPSYYGQQMAKKISGDLVLNHFTVVSGLARGIDASAHLGCLSNEGSTIAVLGNGVDIIYPKENSKLYDEIIEKGTLVSEYFPGTQPVPGNFPARNRIISGLSLGVMVIEAGEKSGALITADFAMEQGRDVFALPGMVTNPFAKGANGLIKQGAKLVESAADIIEEYYPERLFLDRIGNSKKEKGLSIIEKQVLLLVEQQPLHIDEIYMLVNKNIVELNSVLLQLEIKGLVKKLPGKIYSNTF